MTSQYSHMSKNNKNYAENNEYYTPRWIFEKLNMKFDLDVCAPENGVEWIPTNNYYHLAMDGLNQSWYGKVWCNPPYSLPSPWVDKFVEHKNGIILVPFSKSKWFGKLWDNVDCIVALSHNFKFEHKEHGTKSVFMPVFLASMGDYCTNYLRASGIGRMR